ncbi:hypothetical protein GUITHDRAFT_134097 [Guillardia theta CCMP2712]|uniref:Sfi1 spindle body domain-containing protein n=1 Tax=Guillardia theta (strain CCMP2712) TaxID=905079 RepID=L1JT38_GUITC|nr:hypothetical protein GUITHDRAFT_134097 [Guillardia theta CCMP2712]EKX51731.1 hypothetical protein GUITHDRAFT_134097 [Guillardia theta CCMP2712]|eukprot:XP_005838711.1 hypothetical protein GUITHDRAFT_134097 [Guillardia theta CCMP2712]
MKGIVANDQVSRNHDKTQRSVLFFDILSEKVCSPFALNKLTVAASYWGMESIPLRHAFASWRIVSERIRAAKHSLKSVLKFWLHGAVSCFLRDWRQFCIREIELRRIQMRISLRWKIFEATNALRMWQNYFRRERMRKLRESVIASHTALSMQSRYSKEWKEFFLCSKYMEHARAAAAKALTRRRRKQILNLFWHWTSRSYWKRVRLHAGRLVEERRTKSLKASVLETWLTFLDVILSAKSFSLTSQSSNRSFPVIDEACAGLESLLFGLKMHVEKALSLNQSWDEPLLNEAIEVRERNGDADTAKKIVMTSNHVEKKGEKKEVKETNGIKEENTVKDAKETQHDEVGLKSGGEDAGATAGKKQKKESSSSTEKEDKAAAKKHEGAGHEDGFVTADHWPGCVLKKTNHVEHEALQELMGNEMRSFCPEYRGKAEEGGHELAILQDLTAGLKWGSERSRRAR